MIRFICFDCFNVFPYTENSRCTNCSSNSILLFDDNLLLSNPRFKLRVMMKVLQPKDFIIYLLDLAIYSYDHFGQVLFPHISIEEIRERKSYVIYNIGRDK